ncbi:uncharacterized protein LOC127253740 [Andrographis paniculata]|uniref:uncharacterized protein LOC127253740 n=1 Tax=Andrographis paniculata TaxID=175694 RepID=UPI0021E8E533|nr:uncharacterized protein LOC127253740 [Andrographis paniculata]
MAAPNSSLIHISFALVTAISLLFTHSAFSLHSPEYSPSSSPSPAPALFSPEAPSPSPQIESPPAPAPAPAPSDPSLNSSSPAPSPEGGEEEDSRSPAPAPVVAGDVRHESGAADLTADESSGGMNGGKKAGVAIGVIAAAGVLMLGAMVYRKRQRNIRRSQYGYSARREDL